MTPLCRDGATAGVEFALTLPPLPLETEDVAAFGGDEALKKGNLKYSSRIVGHQY